MGEQSNNGIKKDQGSQSSGALEPKELRKRKREKVKKKGPKVHKLRLALILAGLSIIASISTIFGMMMAVASDIPKLEARNEYKEAENSIVYDAKGRKIGVLTGRKNRILVDSDQISTEMKQAIVAIEDKRFYEHKGIDYTGIARALWQDILQQQAVQGASTITQQFVKNALNAQRQRTVFQKLKEASIAYHLENKWSKDKILTEYLNAAYFGNGAYGVESAARAYFQKTAHDLTTPEAALLAGMVASPSAYDPVQRPNNAKARRDLVLLRMYEQGVLDELDYRASVRTALPPLDAIQPPTEQSEAPYFTDYLKTQLVERYGAGRTFGGGMRIRTPLDLDMQKAAENAVQSYTGGLGPAASLVAIDNDTGAVKAMVGGDDFKEEPFNLAINAFRQPGSSFKMFTLVTALKQGISPGATYVSKPVLLPDGRGGMYKVSNYEDSYLGSASMETATVYSDNSVYAQIGKQVGTRNVAETARDMGIDSNISTNAAMVLGGVKQGFSTFQMAHAYETLQQNGWRVSGSLAPRPGAPVSVLTVKNKNGNYIDRNKTVKKQVVPKAAAETAKYILQGVVAGGTGKRAAVSGTTVAGKTGTTDNYADAWFVGFNDELTVAVWVGYLKPRPMESEYGGQPVAGGTIPAEIFASFMSAVLSGFEYEDGEGVLGPTGPDEGTAEPAPDQDPGQQSAQPGQGGQPDAPAGEGGSAEQAPSPPPEESAPAPSEQPSDSGGSVSPSG